MNEEDAMVFCTCEEVIAVTLEALRKPLQPEINTDGTVYRKRDSSGAKS